MRWAAAALTVGVVAAGALPAAAVTPTVAPPQALIIGVDVSRSLSEQQFGEARQAAAAIVPRLENDLPLGLLRIDTAPDIVVAPAQTLTVDDEILGLQREGPGGRTAVWDAVARAVEELEGYQQSRLLLLTDGFHEEGAVDDPATLVPSLVDAGIQVSVVFIPTAGDTAEDDTRRAGLQALTDATGGQLYEARLGDDFAANLESAFAQVAPPEPTPSPTLVPSTLSPTSVGPAPLGPPVSPPTPPLFADWVPLAAVGGLAAALAGIVLVIGALVSRARGPEWRRRRQLETYSVTPGRTRPQALQEPNGVLAANPVTRSAVELADRVVTDRPVGRDLAKRLETADLPLRPGEFVVAQVGASLALGLLFLALSGGQPLALVLGLVLGAGAAQAVLVVLGNRRRRAFSAGLPDTLALLASTLRVGHSLPMALSTVAREGREPIRTEFNRALVETRLGVPAEQALEAMAERIDSDDFRWAVMAINVQRTVGGNLAEILDTVAATMRERVRLRRQVDALSAEGRLSAWIVGGLPVVFVVYLSLVRPSYLTPLVTDPLGWLLIALAVLLFGVGVIGLRWAVKVNV